MIKIVSEDDWGTIGLTYADMDDADLNGIPQMIELSNRDSEITVFVDGVYSVADSTYFQKEINNRLDWATPLPVGLRVPKNLWFNFLPYWAAALAFFVIGACVAIGFSS